MGYHWGLCYFVHMPNFLEMLKNAADAVLGRDNHQYGYATDTLVSRDDGTRQLKRELQQQQYAPPDPNVHYPNQDLPHLQRMPAAEPVFPASPAQRLKDAARRIVEQNRAIDAEVEWAKKPKEPEPKDDYDPDLI